MCASTFVAIKSGILTILVSWKISIQYAAGNCGDFVSEEDIRFYAENGYVMIPNILNSESLNAVQQSYQSLFDRRLSAGDELQATWKGDWDESTDLQSKRKVYSIHDVEFYDFTFSRYLLFNEKVGCFLEMGTNSSNVLLHHTKAHTKPSKIGAAFPPHQDYQYFPYAQDSMVAIFVHLDDTDQRNGGLAIWPGSHLEGAQYDAADPSTGFHYLSSKEFPLSSGQSVIANAGDAVMFSYFTVHASYPNTSDRERRMVLIQGVAAEDEPLSLIHRHSKGQGLVLRGINPKLKQSSHYKRHEDEVKGISESNESTVDVNDVTHKVMDSMDSLERKADL